MDSKLNFAVLHLIPSPTLTRNISFKHFTLFSSMLGTMSIFVMFAGFIT